MPTFDERAATWDTPDRIARAEAVAAAIRASVPLPSGTRAIEVGAGTGLLGLQLVDQLAELVLADSSDGMLEVAAEKVRRGRIENVRTVELDLLTDPPPPGAPFDLVLSLLLLHHLEDPAAALARIRGLVHPGGWIALSDLDSEDGSFHAGDAEGVHHRGFDRPRLAAMAEQAGFGEVEMRTGGVIQKATGNYPLFLLTGRAG